MLPAFLEESAIASLIREVDSSRVVPGCILLFLAVSTGKEPMDSSSVSALLKTS